MLSDVEAELKVLEGNKGDFANKPLYREPTDLPSFVDMLHRQEAFIPRLKAVLQKRFAGRDQQLKALARRMTTDGEAWLRRVRQAEDSSSEKAELSHLPPTKHIHNILPPASAPASALALASASSSSLRGGAQPEPSGAVVKRGSRGGDAVRSEEELARVIQSLLEQDRGNPETRWMATAAIVPPMLSASAKCIFNDKVLYSNRQITAVSGPSAVVDLDPVWTDSEERAFVERYLASPKNFRKIAAGLPFKTAAQCVRFYYQSKRRLGLKAQLQQRAYVQFTARKRAASTAEDAAEDLYGGTSRRKPGRPPNGIISKDN